MPDTPHNAHLTPVTQPIADSIREPPPPTTPVELGVVLVLPVALFVCVEAWQFHTGQLAPFDDRGLWTLIASEVSFGAIALWLLRRKGWRWSTVSLAPAWRDLARALALYIGVVVLYRVGLALGSRIAPALEWVARRPTPADGASIWTILVLVLVNPVFEEGLWLAYVFNGPGRGSVKVALALSVACRVSLHLYQGWIAVFGIAPIAILFAWYYSRSRRLLPVILTHAALNIATSASYVRASGAG